MGLEGDRTHANRTRHYFVGEIAKSKPRPVDVASSELSHSRLTVVEHNNDPSQ